MKNPFEQSPVLHKPQKIDVCEHGNPRGLCEVCNVKNYSNKKNSDKINFNKDLYSLPIINKDTNEYIDENGKIWVVAKYFRNKYKINTRELYEYLRESGPIEGRAKTGHHTILYDKESVEKRMEEVLFRKSLPQVDGNGIYVDKEGKNWIILSKIIKENKVSKDFLSTFLKNIPFIEGRAQIGKPAKLYDELAIMEFVKKFTQLPKVKKEKNFVDKDKKEWATINYFVDFFKKSGIGYDAIKRLLEDVEKKDGRHSTGGKSKLYNQIEAEKKIQEYLSLPMVDNKREYVDEQGKSWVPAAYFVERYDVGYLELNDYLKKTALISGRYARGKETKLYDKEALAGELKDIIFLPRVDKKTEKYIDDSSEAWVTLNFFRSKYNISKEIIYKIVEDSKILYKLGRGKNGNITKLYNESAIIKKLTENGYFEKKNVSKEKGDNEELKQSLENFAQEVSNAETKNEMARKIREIMELLPENACDILLKYHPEYSGLKNDYVKSVIAEYLGDFLLVRRMWQPKDIEMTKELFSEERFAEALFLKFKEASLAFFQKEKKVNPEAKEYELMMKYFENEELLQAAARISEVRTTIEKLRAYYEDVFRLADKKPGNIVDSLKEGRVFPDINQLINIKELSEKRKEEYETKDGKKEEYGHKLLIADEMGLGKSASVILAKEYLGVKCAVIIMPSNVEDTWKKYLSDKTDKDGKQKGYFTDGAAPKVLTIENRNDLERLKNEIFDYILISQEKMSKDHYLEALAGIDFDMLIVDEVHKLKNIENGIRSENAVKLAEKIRGEDKYLAMLSGTPMPNKVKDLAIILKLLYPRKYKDIDDKVLIDRIIYGDMAGLRQELFSRMQMKEVATSIEIPPLIEEPDVDVELSPEEKEVYQILLEEDELTASQKIIIFRQFLLNPQLLGMEPGFEGAKVKKLRETLAEDLKTKNRIIVWVDSYIDGVIRPEMDKDGKVITESMIDKLKLPKDIVWTIHGEDKNKKKYREEVQQLFNNGGPEKMVLFASGQAADVGVDFSGADEMIHYNEPWSKYDKKQEDGRAHREGQKGPLLVKTLITKGTIEEGIRRYTVAKERAIEKLLRGLDRTEAENEMLKKDANSRKKEAEADHNLSDDIQSGWRKLMLHFGAGWEAGEEYFKNMPEEEKESYAKLYKEYMRLSYQGNNARVSASLLEKMIIEQGKRDERLRVLDIASGPEMLKRCVRENLRDQIYSMDINERHFDEVVDEKRTFRKSYLSLPVRSNSADYYNIGFAFHQTKELKFYKKNYEKLQVMAEMNRVLKVGGRAIISEIHNTEFTNQKKFEEIIGKLGMRIIKEYSDEADGGENYRAHFLILEKVSEIDGYGSDAFRFSEEEKKQKIRELGDKIGKELLSGLEIRDLPRGTSQLNDQRRMIDGFRLGGQEFKIIFTEEDKRLFNEEKKSIKDGEELKKKFGGRVDDIPLAELHKIGFKRKLRNPNLMYKIIEKGGVIVVRGEKKKKEQID